MKIREKSERLAHRRVPVAEMAFYNQTTLAFPQAQLEEESKPAPDLGQP